MTHALARWSRAEERLKRIEAAADALAEEISHHVDHMGETVFTLRLINALAAYRKAKQET